ncbi:MAG: type II secretion system F family protein [Candidatus Omnitrophica bacterium]|nr:type II secretion system F family protein [Candidatus Omnitrophota bacterium]
MPKFQYNCRDRQGKVITGQEDAASSEDLLSRLQARDLIVVSIAQEGAAEQRHELPSQGIKASSRRKRYRIVSGDLVLFCRQLATLLGAGVTILRSLDIISKQVASTKFYNVIQDLEKNMEQGLSLHDAMAKHPKVFSELWVNLVESGEASGNLAIILDRLATYLERNAEFKKKLVSALSYPAILFIVGISAMLFMTIKIIPTFGELFKSFNVELPVLTKALMDISTVIRKYGILLFGGAVALFYMFRKFVSTKDGRRMVERLQFKLPIFGELFRALVVERFSSELSTLIESGVPILYSLEIAEQSVGNLVVADIIHDVKESVRDGRPLSLPLEKSGFFEPMVVQMVTIGEEVGELSPMLKKVNAYYQSYVENFLARLTAMFEPIMLIFMGFVIGIMVIGMFLPIFQIAKLG